MRSRVLSRCLLAGLCWAAPAVPASVQAQVNPGSVPTQPTGPVERTVVTGDGAMYRGEVVEYVIGDHITLKLDSGELKRIAFSDAAHISPPRPKAPAPVSPGVTYVPSTTTPPPAVAPTVTAPAPSPTPVVTTGPAPTGGGAGVVASGGIVLPPPPDTFRTVVTRDGFVYFGEVLEYDHGSHLTLKLATGEKRRIPWAETKRISPARGRGELGNDMGSPERTVVLRDGSTVKGELVEALSTDHTTLRLTNGQIRTLRWNEIRRIIGPRPSGAQVIPTKGEMVVFLESGSRLQAEFFEYSPDEMLVIRLVAGGYRSVSLGQIRKIVLLDESNAQ